MSYVSENNFSEDQISKLKETMEKMIGSVEQSIASDKEFDSSLVMEESEFEKWDSKGTNFAKGTYVRVSEDNMTAWIFVAPPDRKQTYVRSEIETFLKAFGVVKGYHSSNISAIIKKKIYAREVVVALGKEITEGKDGYFDYLFSPEEYGVPKIRKDGTVDYTNVTALHNVRQGEKIAIYYCAEQGMDGYDVLGNEKKAKPARDLPPIRGKGIMRENNIYYAQTDGKIEVKDDKIDIQKVHEINGNVDGIIGKVEFFGDVIVNGDVEAGVVIRAGRNVEIHGTSSGATIFAGGDVVLSRGIQGGGKISARGNVFADFIENTEVNVSGNVSSNTLLNAYVSAKGKVILTGKKGAIIGGYTHGVKGVEAVTAGNDVEIKTSIHAGYESETFERLVVVRKREEEVKEELAKLVDTMSDTLREKRIKGSRVASIIDAKLLEWNNMKDEYFKELDELSQEKEKLEEIIRESKGTYIKLDGTIYRNVMIGINADKMSIEKNTSFMKYTADKGFIESELIVH